MEFPGAELQTNRGDCLGRMEDDGCRTCGYYRSGVRFSVASLDEEISILFTCSSCSPFSCSRLESIAAFPPGPHFFESTLESPFSTRSNKWAHLLLCLDVRCGPFGSRRLVLLQIVRCYARKTQAILYDYIILLALLRQIHCILYHPRGPTSAFRQ